jgi:hypothetical protein|eukprot:COSAG01_NODE_7688_length_3098_cov_71.936646_5_plen_138_part_00
MSAAHGGVLARNTSCVGYRPSDTEFSPPLVHTATKCVLLAPLPPPPTKESCHPLARNDLYHRTMPARPGRLVGTGGAATVSSSTPRRPPFLLLVPRVDPSRGGFWSAPPLPLLCLPLLLRLRLPPCLPTRRGRAYLR